MAATSAVEATTPAGSGVGDKDCMITGDTGSVDSGSDSSVDSVEDIRGELEEAKHKRQSLPPQGNINTAVQEHIVRPELQLKAKLAKHATKAEMMALEITKAMDEEAD